MLIREVYDREKVEFDALVDHPLQSWAWGDARIRTGVKVLRLGLFEDGKIKRAWLFTVHEIPLVKKTILYCPKGPMPDEDFVGAMASEADNFGAIYAKVEPAIYEKVIDSSESDKLSKLDGRLADLGFVKGKQLFTKYNFILDLSKSEDELLAQMKPKTRYNVKLAQRKGVSVKIDNSQEAFEKYLELTAETTSRQKFYAHDADYHRHVWDVMHKAGIANLIVARVNQEIVTAWVLFKWKDVLYYPYGASSRKYKKMMASNLVMWKAMKWGKSHGCKKFDFWGTAGINPKPDNPWYGFHRFKQGYGPDLVENIGTYDYSFNPLLYKLVLRADTLRGLWLKLKANLVPSF